MLCGLQEIGLKVMKVFIVTEGGQNIGFGHLTRCISLYQAFEEREIIPEFIINGDNSVKDLLKEKKHQILNWLEEKSELFELVKNADIIIIDSYLADISFYETLSRLVKIPVYIDDTKRLDYPKGIVVNGSIYAKEINYPEKENITYLLGTKYIPLRKEFWDIPAKKINKEVKNILVTFGGINHSDLISKIMGYFKKKFDFNLHVIGPKQNRLNAKEMLDLMLKDDICISGGGQTTYELARVGVPTIGICFADNQLGNILGWEKTGFLKYLGWYNEKNLIEKLKSSMEHLENVNVRKNKSKIGRELVDGKGSLKIIETILPEFFRKNFLLRKAMFEDTLDIFNLSNNGIVRKNSFNPEKIEWNHHLRWLKEKLEDKNCVFFIAVDNLNRFYGQVRFNINPKNKEAIINISLEKNIRGLDLSSFIIDKSVNELLKIKNAKLIKAYIKEKNIPSIRSFEKANFRFLENLIIKGNKSKLYIREV